MCGFKVKSVQSVKDFVVAVTSSLKFSQLCSEAVKNADMLFGLIKRNLSFKYKRIVSYYLYIKVLLDIIWSIYDIPKFVTNPTLKLFSLENASREEN